jgi:hypothetical protein
MTDIECLLNADIGIIMSDTDEDEDGTGIVASIGRCRVAVYHVSCCEPGCEHLRARKREGSDRMLWWARDFREILMSPLLKEHLQL